MPIYMVKTNLSSTEFLQLFQRIFRIETCNVLYWILQTFEHFLPYYKDL